MTNAFKIWTTNRNLHLSFFDNFKLEQLNRIPEGFSNNLIWNLGHIIVTQQILVYKVSGLPMDISDTLVGTYKNGTKPTGQTTKEEVVELKKLMLSLVKKTIEDYNKETFSSFNEITTSTGFHLSSTKEAIEFNNYHEALHLGFMMNIRKFI
jgi:hypothetical protein